MKKYLIAIALIVPFFVSAETTTSPVDLQAVIKQLQTQVADLKTEVQSLKTELKFSRVLTQGAKGDDVKQLQEFLRTFTSAYPDGSVTGYYGPNTKAAVKKFQAQNGIEAVGIVGPKTQEKLGVLAAAIPAVQASTETKPNGQTTTVATTPATPQNMPETEVPPAGSPGPVQSVPCKTPTKIVQAHPASILIHSPNGGEEWQIGGTYTIKYSAKETVGNKALLIYLEKGYDAPSTKVGANSGLLIGVTTNLESYTYKVPQNTQFWPGLGSNYKITVMVEGSLSSCGDISYDGDSSDATFSIIAGQDNVQRTIPTPTTSVTTAPAPVNGGGYGKENTSDSLSYQISALQKKIENTTDDAIRTSLINQITELKKQSQILDDKKMATLKQIMALEYKLYYATDAVVRASLEAQIIALGGQVHTPSTPTIQDQINALLGKINAHQDKLNKTTDTSARDSLMAQIATFKAQLLILQSTPTTTAQPTTPMPLDTTTSPTSIPAGCSSIVGFSRTTGVSCASGAVTTTATPSGERNAEDLLKQINSLQGQLNITTDILKRDNLIKIISEMQAHVQLLQGN